MVSKPRMSCPCMSRFHTRSLKVRHKLSFAFEIRRIGFGRRQWARRGRARLDRWWPEGDGRWPAGLRRAHATYREVRCDPHGGVRGSSRSAACMVNPCRPGTLRRREERLRTRLHSRLRRPQSVSPDLRQSHGPLSMRPTRAAFVTFLAGASPSSVDPPWRRNDRFGAGAMIG